MALTQYQVLLVLVMIVTGSINTISTKWADTIESVGRDGVKKPFDHPFFQATFMFVGEIYCLVTFKLLYNIYSRRADGSEDVNELTKGNRNFNPFLFYIPALCDMVATSLMYIGLNLTYASSFQMFRGAVIIFVGLLSVGFLERVLKPKEWTGIFLVIGGLLLVGAGDFFSKDTTDSHLSRNDIISGDLLIVLAQIITAIQMVYEEKFVSGLDIPPLQAVGWEGLFGCITLVSLQIPFYYIKAGPPVTRHDGDRLEDPIDALVQIKNSWQLMMAISGTVLSIAFFNFAGLSVTKEMSATTRMMIDSVRTLVVWVFSLVVFGQQFHWLQLIGFNLLVLGMCFYNDVSFKSIYIAIRSRMLVRRSHLEDDTIINRNAEDTEVPN